MRRKKELRNSLEIDFFEYCTNIIPDRSIAVNDKQLICTVNLSATANVHNVFMAIRNIIHDR